MPVLTFLPRFHDLIRTGRKRHTIRGDRPDIHPGTHLMLRAWTGKPYASPQTDLAAGTCTTKRTIIIALASCQDRSEWSLLIELGGMSLDLSDIHRLAKSDGFLSTHDMAQHFVAHRNLRKPGDGFTGCIYGWEPADIRPRQRVA